MKEYLSSTEWRTTCPEHTRDCLEQRGVTVGRGGSIQG